MSFRWTKIVLFTFLFYVYFYQTDTIQRLQKRIERLESQQKGDIESQITCLSTYRQRNLADLDKYTALSMAELLVSHAKPVNHSKASFLAVASQMLRSHLQKSNKVFQAYFLALFADKNYTQILRPHLEGGQVASFRPHSSCHLLIHLLPYIFTSFFSSSPPPSALSLLLLFWNAKLLLISPQKA